MSPDKDWIQWTREQVIFKNRATRGFTQDLKALKAHILRLQDVCPKDKAGWPLPPALKALNDLRRSYNSVLKYIESTSEGSK